MGTVDLGGFGGISHVELVPSLVERAPDGILVVDAGGCMVLVNARLGEIFGYAHDELIDQPLELLVPDRLRDLHTSHRLAFGADPRTRDMGTGLELFGRRKDGSEFPIDVSLGFVDIDGERLVTAFVRDVTARKQAEEALRESEERFRVLVSTVVDYAICMLDTEGRVVTWNEGAERMTGYTPAEMLGQPVTRLYPPADVGAGVPERELAAAARDGSFHSQGWRVRKDGSRLFADASIAALRDSSGNTRAYARVARDITEQLKVREKLEAINELDRAVLQDLPAAQVLSLVARRARRIVAAALAWVAGPSEDAAHLVIEAADGLGSERLIGQWVSVPPTADAGAAGLAQPVHVDVSADEGAGAVLGEDLGEAAQDLGPAVAIPMVYTSRVFGFLACARRRGDAPFADTDADLLASLAAQTALALAYRAARADIERLLVSEEQERVARDLHDTVIQRLFAAGMTLQSTLHHVPSSHVAERIERTIDELDDVIRSIRTTIFGLQPRDRDRHELRERVLDLVSDMAPAMGFEPVVHFEGPVESLISQEVATELLPTLHEALSNVAKHAQASSATVTLSASRDMVVLTVTDDGAGIPPSSGDGGRGTSLSGSGVRNMSDRATRLGGELNLRPAEPHGTLLEWRVPA